MRRMTLNKRSYPKEVPDTYIIHRIYSHRKERVYVFTNGECYIYADAVMDDECGLLWLTVSAPCIIGNACPEGG